VRKGYIDTEFGQVHYYAAGESGPLLFLFHETALAASEFSRTLPILGEKCRAVALDTPGYGMSDPPSAPLDMQAFATRFCRAIEAFGDGPCILAGAHTGSSFALELATQQLAERVTHVVLSGLALLTANEIEGFRKIIGAPELDHEGRFLIEEWEKRRQRWGEATPLDDILWGTAEQLMVYQRFHWAFEAVFSHDAELALKKLNCPTLFLIGEDDSLVDSDRRAATLVTDAELKVLPGVGGRLPYFEPERYAREVLRFAGLG
jgi:pimeloyl-ACP methyl ester carboxylesterase